MYILMSFINLNYFDASSFKSDMVKIFRNQFLLKDITILIN